MYESACCQVGVFLSFVFSLSRVFARPWAATAVSRIEFLLLLSSASLSFVLEQLVISFRRESCIRRGFRHEPVLIGCRIHPETCVPVRRVSRLAELGRTCSGRVPAGWPQCRIFVRLALAEHPEAGLGQMSRDGALRRV